MFMIENTQKIHFQKLLYLKWPFLCLEDFSKSVKFVFSILTVSALPSPATVRKGETAEIQWIFSPFSTREFMRGVPTKNLHRTTGLVDQIRSSRPGGNKYNQTVWIIFNRMNLPKALNMIMRNRWSDTLRSDSYHAEWLISWI